jgi:hypothetical protein
MRGHSRDVAQVHIPNSQDPQPLLLLLLLLALLVLLQQCHSRNLHLWRQDPIRSIHCRGFQLMVCNVATAQ